MALGWIYILSNPSMPNLVKIGFSSKDPELRMKELDGTGIPTPFEVIYWALVDEPYATEQSLHSHLNAHRLSQQREFFKLSEVDSVALVTQFIKQKNIKISLELNKIQAEIKTSSSPVIKKIRSYNFTNWNTNLTFVTLGELIDSAREKYSSDSILRCLYVLVGLYESRPYFFLKALSEPYSTNLSNDEFDLVTVLYLTCAGKWLWDSSDYLDAISELSFPKRVIGEYENFPQNLQENELKNLKIFFNDFKQNIFRERPNKFPSKQIFLYYVLCIASRRKSELIDPLTIPECRYLLQEMISNALKGNENYAVTQTIRRFLTIAPQAWFNDKPYLSLCKLSSDLFESASREKNKDYIDLVLDLGVNFNDRWQFDDRYFIHDNFLRKLIGSDSFLELCNSLGLGLSRFGDARTKLSHLSSLRNDEPRSVSHWTLFDAFDSSQKEAIRPDGATVVTDADGSQHIFNEDGTVEVINPDGSREIS